MRKCDISNLLLEKYNGSIIHRSRDCRFIVDHDMGGRQTLHCLQVRTF